MLYLTSLCFSWLRVAFFYSKPLCFVELYSVSRCVTFGSLRFVPIRFVSLRFASLRFAAQCFDFALLRLDLFPFAVSRFNLLFLQVLARSGERWRVFASAGKCLRVLMSVMRSARFASLARGARTACEEHLRASWERSGSASLRFASLRFALLRFVLLGFACPSLCFASFRFASLRSAWLI